MARQKKNNETGGNMPIILAGAVFLAMVVYLGYQTFVGDAQTDSAMNQTTVSSSARPGMIPGSKANLIETRPVMPASHYTGKVAQTYKWAAEIPQAFDALFCYCMCKDNPDFRHKTLLTCYVDAHASRCGICLKEGQMAWELTQQGMAPQEIRKRVDSYYAKIRRGSRL